MSVVLKEFPAEEEYKKKTGITKEDIKKLREWVQTQPHLPADHITANHTSTFTNLSFFHNQTFSGRLKVENLLKELDRLQYGDVPSTVLDLDLILTYHCCEKSAGVAKQVLDLNLTLRTLFHQIFKNRVLDERHEKALRTLCFRCLPQRTPEGYAVFYCRLVDVDPSHFDCNALIRVVLMLVELWQYEEGTWPGFVIAVDLQGMALGHIARLDLHSVQQYFYYLQEAMLLKLKGFHFLNAPSFMDKLMMVLRPFFKRELLAMLHIHDSGASTVQKFLPMEHFPKAEELSMLQAQLISHLRANMHYFEEESRKRVVEAKRPGKPKTITDIFGGIEGSFKKLDID